jgi:hypothetical protein
MGRILWIGPAIVREAKVEMDDLFSVEGKMAVVTGGSRGIGLMVARGGRRLCHRGGAAGFTAGGITL